MNPFLVVNPRSANGATARHFDSLSQAVRNAVGECAHAFTERPMHAAELTRKALSEGHDLVINVGEIGVGAKVVDIANASSKVLGGKATFMLASMRALVGWKDLPVRASFDGGPMEDLKVTTLAIANGRYFGGGMMVAPEARLEDGLFHITIWSGYSLSDFILK